MLSMRCSSAVSLPGTALHRATACPAVQQHVRRCSLARAGTICGLGRSAATNGLQSTASYSGRQHLPFLQRRQSSLLCEAAAAADAGAVPLPEDAKGKSSFAAGIRGFCFYLWTLTLSLPLFVTMLVMAPFVMLFDKVRRLWQHKVNNVWARASTTPWYGIKLEGLENLPAFDEPAVYIANHQSFLDIFSLFHLGRPFKFVSKTSNFFIPIVGWSMFLTGHVMINRVDNRSMIKCLSQCKDLLAQGASVLFFPEGTRTKDGKMAAFKKGAFSVAVKAGVPVVPITLIGTGALMPNGQEGKLYSGEGVRIIVHKPITGTNADSMMKEARQAIASPLPPALVA
mmetsp:Transcript_14175/g.42773  ORF Transcript_14175/g.42773 Transcript_14175/m.42773 type:complete len:341 (-) Transcript_14175:1423-2445(-)